MPDVMCVLGVGNPYAAAPHHSSKYPFLFNIPALNREGKKHNRQIELINCVQSTTTEDFSPHIPYGMTREGESEREGREREKNLSGLAQTVLFIIINSNVMRNPPGDPLTASPPLRSHSLAQTEGNAGAERGRERHRQREGGRERESRRERERGRERHRRRQGERESERERTTGSD